VRLASSDGDVVGVESGVTVGRPSVGVGCGRVVASEGVLVGSAVSTGWQADRLIMMMRIPRMAAFHFI
jgi:hypothetical protein